ncbi:MAG: type IV toxin-antitoxin system AbiEi family antitoxin [Coriobacteriia bacterium]|nr:type IV toxin-antitoxin system AbiEi family antitoxin [Coriobacteriia bacterium]
MPLQYEKHSRLERALRDLFPDQPIELHPENRRHATAGRADVEARVGDLYLLIEIVDQTSTAQLKDAAGLLCMRQGERSDALAVLAAPYFSPAKQELLRAASIAFLDYAGNAWISAPGVHIDRRGFLNPDKETREHRDLFSDKASLVLRTLLMAESPIGIRQIAELVGSCDERITLTPGYVSKVVQELERRGYAARRSEGIVLRHGPELLGDWVAAHRSRRPRDVRMYFITAPNAESVIAPVADVLAARRIDHVFTGHAGASVVDPYAAFDAVDLYVREVDSARGALEDFGARPVDRGGNVNLLVPYYRTSAFYGSQVARVGETTVRVASDIQLYLDLYDAPVRGREQAEHLYDRRLRPLLERDDRL